MSTKTLTYALIALIVVAVAINFALTDAPVTQPTLTTGGGVAKANPASVFCVDNGGTLSLNSSDDGVTGTCTFSSGEQCEEWALFRGECDIEGVSKHVVYSNGSQTVHAVYRGKHNTVLVNAPEINIDNMIVVPAVSASGARYESADKRTEFWEHQGELTLSVDGEQRFVGKLVE